MYFQRFQRAVLGTVKKGFVIVSVCRLIFKDIDLFGKSGDTCNLKIMLDFFVDEGCKP
jgi:hypothetical protein